MDLSKDLSREDFKGYKAQLETSIKIAKMAVLVDENTLKWVNEQLEKRPEEKAKK